MKNEIKIKRIEISFPSLVIEDLDLSFEGSEKEMVAYILKVIQGLKTTVG